MRRTWEAVLVFVTLMPTALPGQARDSGAYVVRLGSDTIAIERYVRTSRMLIIDAVTRLPQTRLARLVVRREADGRIASYEHANSPAPGAGGAAEIVTTAQYRGDSVRIEVVQGTNAPRVRTIAGTPDMLPLVAPIYSTHSFAIAAARARGDTVLTLLSSQGPVVYQLRFAGDTVFMTGPGPAGTLKASWDDDGMSQLDGRQTTFKVIVTRTAWFEPDSVARRFAREDALGRALGVLSPRDTIRARIAGASLLLAYGRPSTRGRVIFGGIVPYNEVWRTGANAATEFETDRPLVMSGQTIAAGRYTLWTIPRRENWLLIINRQTGQWGTSYDPAHDVARIVIPVQTVAVPTERFTIEVVESGQGGAIQFTWDRTRATARFTVRRDGR